MLYLNVSFKSIDYEKVLFTKFFCDVLMGTFADSAGKGCTGIVSFLPKTACR